jgi:general nucleoside transport system permease protein
MSLTIAILMTIFIAATPLLLAALGELVVEKSGVLNLGMEGMMLMGAVTGFIVAFTSNSLLLGALAAILAGVLMSALFALLILKFNANQVATGLALTIFGSGLSAMIGTAYVGKTFRRFAPVFPDALSQHPILKVIFGYNLLVYGAIALVFVIWYFLMRTKTGLILRAAGEHDGSAHAIGYRVNQIRFFAILFGGGCAGLAGSYFSLYLTPLWSENLTAGRGWIALALVVFATWRPFRVWIGALLFGGVVTLELHSKAAGIALAPELVASMPYLMTILVLTIIMAKARSSSREVPAGLGKNFSP